MSLGVSGLRRTADRRGDGTVCDVRTLPVGAAATLLYERVDLASACAGAGIEMGRRIEVDLDVVASEVSPGLADILEAYGHQCDRLWDDYVSGRAGIPYVVVRRMLTQHAQVTGKTGRRDLNAVYTVLESVPALAGALDVLTAPELDVDRARAVVAGANGELQVEVGVAHAAFTLEGRHALPEALGGVPYPNEFARIVTLSIRHAAWRDRRVRRLGSVRIDVDELWADPRPLQAALDALPPLNR